MSIKVQKNLFSLGVVLLLAAILTLALGLPNWGGQSTTTILLGEDSVVMIADKNPELHQLKLEDEQGRDLLGLALVAEFFLSRGLKAELAQSGAFEFRGANSELVEFDANTSTLTLNQQPVTSENFPLADYSHLIQKVLTEGFPPLIGLIKDETVSLTTLPAQLRHAPLPAISNARLCEASTEPTPDAEQSSAYCTHFVVQIAAVQAASVVTSALTLTGTSAATSSSTYAVTSSSTSSVTAAPPQPIATPVRELKIEFIRSESISDGLAITLPSLPGYLLPVDSQIPSGEDPPPEAPCCDKDNLSLEWLESQLGKPVDSAESEEILAVLPPEIAQALEADLEYGTSTTTAESTTAVESKEAGAPEAKGEAAKGGAEQCELVVHQALTACSEQTTPAGCTKTKDCKWMQLGGTPSCHPFWYDEALVHASSLDCTGNKLCEFIPMVFSADLHTRLQQLVMQKVEAGCKAVKLTWFGHNLSNTLISFLDLCAKGLNGATLQCEDRGCARVGKLSKLIEMLKKLGKGSCISKVKINQTIVSTVYGTESSCEIMPNGTTKCSACNWFNVCSLYTADNHSAAAWCEENGNQYCKICKAQPGWPAGTGAWVPAAPNECRDTVGELSPAASQPYGCCERGGDNITWTTQKECPKPAVYTPGSALLHQACMQKRSNSCCMVEKLDARRNPVAMSYLWRPSCSGLDSTTTQFVGVSPATTLEECKQQDQSEELCCSMFNGDNIIPIDHNYLGASYAQWMTRAECNQILGWPLSNATNAQACAARNALCCDIPQADPRYQIVAGLYCSNHLQGRPVDATNCSGVNVCCEREDRSSRLWSTAAQCRSYTGWHVNETHQTYEACLSAGNVCCRNSANFESAWESYAACRERGAGWHIPSAGYNEELCNSQRDQKVCCIPKSLSTVETHWESRGECIGRYPEFIVSAITSEASCSGYAEQQVCCSNWIDSTKSLMTRRECALKVKANGYFEPRPASFCQ